MTRKILLLTGALVLMTLAYFIGQVVANFAAEKRESQLVAVSWGDGRYGPAFYGAYVFLVPANDGFSVQAKLKIGRGNSMYRECGELGRARTAEESVARWGNIEWKTDGLHIGRGSDEYFLPQKEVENHR